MATVLKLVAGEVGRELSEAEEAEVVAVADQAVFRAVAKRKGIEVADDAPTATSDVIAAVNAYKAVLEDSSASVDAKLAALVDLAHLPVTLRSVLKATKIGVTVNAIRKNGPDELKPAAVVLFKAMRDASREA